MAFQLAPFLAQSAGGVGVLGAIVGGSAAVAANYKKFREGNIDAKSASVDVGKEAVGAGVATAASAVAAGIVGGGLTVSIVTVIVVASGAKYAWDKAIFKLEDMALDKDQEDDLL